MPPSKQAPGIIFTSGTITLSCAHRDNVAVRGVVYRYWVPGRCRVLPDAYVQSHYSNSVLWSYAVPRVWLRLVAFVHPLPTARARVCAAAISERAAPCGRRCCFLFPRITRLQSKARRRSRACRPSFGEFKQPPLSVIHTRSFVRWLPECDRSNNTADHGRRKIATEHLTSSSSAFVAM